MLHSYDTQTHAVCVRVCVCVCVCVCAHSYKSCHWCMHACISLFLRPMQCRAGKKGEETTTKKGTMEKTDKKLYCSIYCFFFFSSYLHTHAHTHTHTHSFAHIRVHAHTYTHTCTRTQTHTHKTRNFVFYQICFFPSFSLLSCRDLRRTFETMDGLLCERKWDKKRKKRERKRERERKRKREREKEREGEREKERIDKKLCVSNWIK